MTRITMRAAVYPEVVLLGCSQESGRMRNLVMVLMMCGVVGPTLADQPATDLGNTGRFEFDRLPHLVAPGWNLDNLEYPAEVGTTHSVTVRLAAKYSGSAFVGVSIPGAGALLDLGGGNCTLWQRVGDNDQRVNETALVRQAIADWRADALHSYTLEWTPTGKSHDLPCRLLIDGKSIKTFRGHQRATPFDPTLEISFENGTATGLLDSVAWNINFVSLHAGPDPGQLTTKPFTSPPGKLYLNVDARDGEVLVEVLDSNGEVLAKSRSLAGDYRRLEIADIADFGKVAGESSIQLRVTLHSANLFSYWFE